LCIRQTAPVQAVVFWALLPLFVGAYLWACRLVLHAEPTWTAVAVATLILLPIPALRAVYILPGPAWLSVLRPAGAAGVEERLSFRAALERGRRLGVADYVHALGSLAALVIVVGIAANTLSVLLHTQGDNGRRVAVALSDLVLSPLLFVGGALLYVDQAARA